MFYKIYLYKKCSTCQEAVRFLNDHQISYEIKEITETPPSAEELKRMLAHVGGNLKKLFNTSGLLYKELKLSERFGGLSEEQALDLLSKHGMLVKRPFLLGKRDGVVGFNETQWKLLLSSIKST